LLLPHSAIQENQINISFYREDKGSVHFKLRYNNYLEEQESFKVGGITSTVNATIETGNKANARNSSLRLNQSLVLWMLAWRDPLQIRFL